MQVAWSMLRKPEPTALAAARALAHRAAQWPARAALANLKPLPDESHASLAWDPEMAALLGQKLPGGARVGLRIAVHELVFVKGKRTEAFRMGTRSEAEAGSWLDGTLAAAGLKPASGTKLPYDMPSALFARPAQEAANLATLSVWFAAGAELLEELREKYKRLKPGPVRCWPHHFDIAAILHLDRDRPPEAARQIGFGLSPGDQHNPEPYFYLTPHPIEVDVTFPPLPSGGRWQRTGFTGAVLLASDLLQGPPDGQLDRARAYFDAAFATARHLIGPARFT